MPLAKPASARAGLTARPIAATLARMSENSPAPPTGRLDPRMAEALREAGFSTICAHLGEDRAAQKGAAAPAIYQSSTFVYPSAEAFEQRQQPDSPFFDYTRVGNPTTAILEAKLARLERGEWCRAFGSGMGAVSGAINACVEAGSHVVAVSRCYHPTRVYLHRYLRRFGVSVSFVRGPDPGAFEAALRPETRLLYLESPTSGTFECMDVRALTGLARARGIRTVFDNSWATPLFQNPLELGCDLVVHTATKYLGGHSDVVAGAVIGRDPGLHEAVKLEAELLGATIDPFAAWLVLRGLRTLEVRLGHHQRSALEIARFLEQHPKVARVAHPGLPSHPQHAIARRQLSGYSGLFSFALRDGSREATFRVVNRLRLFSIGVSWGGYESLVIGGALFSEDPSNPEYVIRLSIGLESTTDLLADLKQALE